MSFETFYWTVGWSFCPLVHMKPLQWNFVLNFVRIKKKRFLFNYEVFMAQFRIFLFFQIIYTRFQLSYGNDGSASYSWWSNNLPRSTWEFSVISFIVKIQIILWFDRKKSKFLRFLMAFQVVIIFHLKNEELMFHSR